MGEPAAARFESWRRRLPSLRRRARGALPFVWGVIAALIAVLLYHLLVPGPHPLTTGDVDTSIAHALASVTPPPADAALVYQAIRPSFVLVQAQERGATGQPEQSLGSGVVIDAAGDVLTSLHVVAKATAVQLTFADGTRSPAQVVTAQPDHDIAVLRADRPPAQLVPATLGNPNAMNVGDEAFVVGNPFGLYDSMSAGVISGFDRTFTPAGGGQPLKGLIQFDAAVNPGNSGGPLLNRAGQVIGIVTGLANPTDQDFFVGLGFAVPIDVAGGAAGLPPY